MSTEQAARLAKKNIEKKKGKGKFSFFSAGGSFDLPFFFLILALLAIGLVMMFSASYAYAYYTPKFHGDSLYFLKPQLLYAAIGIALMIGVSLIDYRVLHFWSLIFMGISYALLVIVLFMPAQNGAHRWIPYPINFQPSEIAKFALIATFAHLRCV